MMGTVIARDDPMRRASLNPRLPGRKCEMRDAMSASCGYEDDDPMTLKLSDTMHDADFVVIDGVVFETAYVRVPDEYTVADDVVLEARHGDTELAFTQADFEGAEHVADGFYRLCDGHLVRFLTSATVH